MQCTGILFSKLVLIFSNLLQYLAVFKQVFPRLPIIGLTATMTSQVQSDVKKILNITNCLNFKASFNRPNLYYEVRIFLFVITSSMMVMFSLALVCVFPK